MTDDVREILVLNGLNCLLCRNIELRYPNPLLERWVKPKPVTDLRTETISRVKHNHNFEISQDQTNLGHCFALQRIRVYSTAPFIPPQKGMGFPEAFL